MATEHLGYDSMLLDAVVRDLEGLCSIVNHGGSWGSAFPDGGETTPES